MLINGIIYYIITILLTLIDNRGDKMNITITKIGRIILGEVPEYLQKRIKKYIKEELRTNSKTNNIRLGRTNRIIIQSEYANCLVDDLDNICTYLARQKIEYKYDFAIGITLDNIDGNFDAYDLMSSLVESKITNVEECIHTAYKLGIMYNDKFYMVDLSAKSVSQISIVIYSDVHNENSISILDDLTNMYYNTLHLNFNLLGGENNV